MISIEEMRQSVKGEILIGVPMSEHTSFKIGGNADFVIKPIDKDDAIATARYFQKKNQSFIVLGKGSNVLVSDYGLRLPVVFFEEALSKYEINGRNVYAEAGVDLQRLSVATFKHNLSGMEMLAGIPGSLGGALLMNAGAYGQEIYDNLNWVEIVGGGEKRKLKKKEIKIKYRETEFKDEVLIAAEFSLNKLDDKSYEFQKKVREENLTKRRESQPLSMPNAGCIFKNVIIDDKIVSAGRLIDQCGLKGLKVGQAMVSEKHANFIVNLGNAKADDVVKLIQTIKAKVKAQHQVSLALEIKMMGFEDLNIQNLTG